jgi:hypothetical protein
MPEASAARDRFDSWKEIAAYIGRDIRTAMRWEKERGLPVHRVPGNGSRQPVFAYKFELDEWLKQRGTARTGQLMEATDQALAAQPLAGPSHSEIEDRYYGRRRVLLFGAIGLAVIVAVSMVTLIRNRSTSPDPALTVRIQFAANTIRALDSAGNVLWTHRFPKPIHSEMLKHPELLDNLVRIVDLYGDGRREALVTIPLEQNADPRAISATEIDCFSNDGKLLWSYVPHEKFQFGSFDPGGPWFVEDVLVSQGVKPAIWAALTNKWGNSFVVQLDSSTGKDTVRFVNTGIIYRLNEVTISGRRYLLIGGFNNEYAAGVLAAVDESKPYATSPQTAATWHKCLTCPEGVPDYYFVFPRSEVNRLLNSWEDSVRFINVQGNNIEVDKSELGDPALGDKTDVGKVHVVYEFHAEPTLRAFAFRFDSWYDMMHRDLQSRGKLDHTLASCPERLHPESVRVWTPKNGWTEVRLPSMRGSR